MLINKTPHAVNIADEQGNIIRTIPPTLPAARVGSKAVQGVPLDGVPFVETIFGELENVPEPDGDTIYIVSQIVIAACPDRLDLVRPDSGPTCLRDDKGQIVSVRALTR